MKAPPPGSYCWQLHASRPLLALVSFLALVSTAMSAYVASHTFTIRDVLRGFDGLTFGQDQTHICGVPDNVNSPTCPEGAAQPIIDKKDNSPLYPIDSEFGFDVVDFTGSDVKTLDSDYQEGFAATLKEGEIEVGLKISNAATDVYKVPPPRGTWCQGVGANSVKCSTERFSVMEHILTCHETIPYFFADPDTGVQGTQATPSGSLSVDCANTELDNYLFILKNGENSTVKYDPVANPGESGYIFPNDNTDALNDMAVSNSYSITLKDDGKVLYRWGNLIKRPKDIRLYAKIPLPPEWKELDEGGNLPRIPVTKAYLVIDHLITNNPNDQVRAEDLENEGATGRKPSYRVDADGRWVSTKLCYEGDGDLIEGGDTGGELEPDEIPPGTVFKQDLGLQGTIENLPITPSEDLQEKFTNAYYTTIERDPFEWSYRNTNTADNVYEFVGSPQPFDDPNLELVSGPRWRLKANKFGQDIPGLEIPIEECSKPPFEKSNIKYSVGQRVSTYINLLDWEDGEESPLSTSLGWVDVGSNENVVLQEDVTVNIDGKDYPVSINGLPMTDDFDLAIYIKGDRKPTSIYSAQLVLDYEGAPDDDGEADLVVEIIEVVPERPTFNEEFVVYYSVTNVGTSAATGVDVNLSYSDNKGGSESDSSDGNIIAPDKTLFLEWTYMRPPPDKSQGNVQATVTVTATEDATPDGDNTDTIDFQIKKQ